MILPPLGIIAPIAVGLNSAATGCRYACRLRLSGFALAVMMANSGGAGIMQKNILKPVISAARAATTIKRLLSLIRSAIHLRYPPDRPLIFL